MPKPRNERQISLLLRFKEHGLAVAVMIVMFSAYVITKWLRAVTGPRSDILEEIFLTITVVLLIHLLDHMFLSGGTLRLIHDEFEPLSKEAKESLRRLEGASESFAAMRQCGLTRIYRSRKEAARDIAKELKAPGVQKIRLIGVSLNDFVLDHGILHEAFRAIQERLEAKSEVEGECLDVKLLVVDPYSYGAQQRHRAETQTSRDHARLIGEVKTVSTWLHDFSKKLRSTPVASPLESPKEMTENTLEEPISLSSDGPGFDCRMYRLAPQLFLAWTDQCCFVEQYYMWTSRDAQNFVPVQRFQKPEPDQGEESVEGSCMESDFHSEMAEHFDWIWNHASVPVADFVPGDLFGFDMGLCQAGAVNVFMEKTSSAKRIVNLLQRVKEDRHFQDPQEVGVDLMGISLRSFFDLRSESEIAQAFAENVLGRPGVRVRILCLDPSCEQAIMRSFREYQLHDSEMSYQSYKTEFPELHKRSSLFEDTEATKRHLANLHVGLSKHEKKDHVGNQSTLAGQTSLLCDLGAWEYSCAPSCFMLRVGATVLFEPYSYGKLDRAAPKPVLSGDMPVFEFQRRAPCLELYDKVPKRNPWGLLKDHFEFAVGLAKPLPVGVNTSPRPVRPETSHTNEYGTPTTDVMRLDLPQDRRSI